MATKVILVNGAALDAKYGESAGQVWAAVGSLIAADAEKGIETQLVRIDEDATPIGKAAVADPTDWRQVKAVVDAVDAAVSPDYLMLLGGPDLIPHCELGNPASGGDDPDPSVPSDLPYACVAPAGEAISEFLAPTRVISRLPDVPGASEPGALLNALGFATGWQSFERQEYEPYLGVSAEVWEGSTRSTLAQLYGSDGETQISPSDGPAWEAALIGRRSHLFNLHGAPASPEFWGQHGDEYPVAHEATRIDGNVTEGTVAAAEACYGAELYEPSDGQVGMPLAYLSSGAYGFFGSTTVAYGPSVGNDYADVICRLFQASILSGASIGRAGLEARQAYIAQSSPLDPIDLKTIGQFLVLGDPSVQPVETAALPAAGGVSHGLPARRERLRARGAALGRTTAWAEPVDGGPQEGVVGRLRELAGVPAAGEPSVASYEVRGGPEPSGFRGLLHAFGAGGQPEPATIHLLMQSIEPESAPMPQRIAVVAVEEGGQLISVKTATTR